VQGDEVRSAVGSVPRSQIHGLAPEYDETDIDILVRPDDVHAEAVSRGEAANGDVDGKKGNATVVTKRYLGPTILYEVELDDGTRVQCMHNHDERVPLDERVQLTLGADHELAWFPCEQRPAIDSREDQLRHGADD
jgi:iron(III) transport system ATP-binding protein